MAADNENAMTMMITACSDVIKMYLLFIILSSSIILSQFGVTVLGSCNLGKQIAVILTSTRLVVDRDKPRNL